MVINHVLLTRVDGMPKGGVNYMERDEKIAITVYGIVVLIFTAGMITGAQFLLWS